MTYDQNGNVLTSTNAYGLAHPEVTNNTYDGDNELSATVVLPVLVASVELAGVPFASEQ